MFRSNDIGVLRNQIDRFDLPIFVAQRSEMSGEFEFLALNLACERQTGVAMQDIVLKPLERIFPRAQAKRIPWICPAVGSLGKQRSITSSQTTVNIAWSVARRGFLKFTAMRLISRRFRTYAIIHRFRAGNWTRSSRFSTHMIRARSRTRSFLQPCRRFPGCVDQSPAPCSTCAALRTTD